MEQSLKWERREPNWVVAAVAGFASGAVLMVLDLLWSSIAAGGGPWQTSHMIAPILLGAQVAPDYQFSFTIVAAALAVHYVLGTVSGLILGTAMTLTGFDTSVAKAVAIGAAFGIVIYVVNFFLLVGAFPWLAELRGWATFAAHIVFGVTAAVLYWKLTSRS